VGNFLRRPHQNFSGLYLRPQVLKASILRFNDDPNGRRRSDNVHRTELFFLSGHVFQYFHHEQRTRESERNNPIGRVLCGSCRPEDSLLGPQLRRWTGLPIRSSSKVLAMTIKNVFTASGSSSIWRTIRL
jgi:hypothetical protein